MINKLNLNNKDINFYTLKIQKGAGNDSHSSYDMATEEALEIYLGGKYLFTDSSYRSNPLPDHIANQFCGESNLVKNATKDYLLNNINSVYRFPDLTLSRDKLAVLKEDCKFNVIRNRDKADMLIISSKTISNMTSVNYRPTQRIDEINNVFKSYVNKFNYQDNIDFMNDIIEKLDSFNDEDMLVIDSNWYVEDENTNVDYKCFQEMIMTLNDKSSSRSDGYVNYINDIDTYKFLVDNSDKLILDTHINKLCVEDSVSFGKEDFERLEQLFKSNDEDNRAVAQTIMANCNVEESKTVLTLIFAFYSYNMKGSKVWNQVNFKYLRKIYENYIDMTMSNWGGAYDNLTRLMCDDKCLNTWSSRYIAKKMFENVIQNNCGAFMPGSVFSTTVESIQLKDEYKDKLNDTEEQDVVEEILEINTINDLPF